MCDGIVVNSRCALCDGILVNSRCAVCDRILVNSRCAVCDRTCSSVFATAALSSLAMIVCEALTALCVGVG